jgi:hypothetical protein
MRTVNEREGEKSDTGCEIGCCLEEVSIGWDEENEEEEEVEVNMTLDDDVEEDEEVFMGSEFEVLLSDDSVLTILQESNESCGFCSLNSEETAVTG